MIRQEKIENSISLITLDTGKGNMLGIDDLQSLNNIIFQEQINPKTQGVILTGTNNCFCTGLKIGDIPTKEFEIFDRLLYELFNFQKPVAVATNGHSIGGGLLIQLCADYIVMSDNEKIKIGLPELKLNTALDSLMIYLLKYSVGNMRHIQELLYSGQYIQPSKSIEYNLCDILVNDSDVFECALGEMKKIISYKQVAFTGIKHSMRKETAMKMLHELNTGCYKIYNMIGKVDKIS